MTSNEPESANRWATEHYGFNDELDGDDAGDGAVATPAARRAPSLDGERHSRRRAGLIASAVLTLALVAGVGGAAVASDDGPDGPGRERHAPTQFEGGPGRGDFGRQGGGGGRT